MFQVPIVILFLTCILQVVTPLAFFSPPFWCAAEGAVLVDPGTTDLVWAENWLSFHVEYQCAVIMNVQYHKMQLRAGQRLYYLIRLCYGRECDTYEKHLAYMSY